MAIPQFKEFILPTLKQYGDGEHHALSDTVERVADAMRIPTEDRNELLPSGKRTRLYDRVSWALTYLKQAKLLELVKRGVHRITTRGRDLLAENPEHLYPTDLNRYPEFVEFATRSNKPRQQEEQSTAADGGNDMTPEEALDASYQQLHESLISEIQEAVANTDPANFEQLVVDLLLAMGYGGSFREAGKAIGRSGDEGIDGIIKEDRLGLDVIYLQAKRWTNNVGRPQIQQFAGALMGKKAKKGVFITTSEFSQEAQSYARSLDSKLILIDGRELANLMIEHGVGVSIRKTFHLKRIDTDYFEME